MKYTVDWLVKLDAVTIPNFSTTGTNSQFLAIESGSLRAGTNYVITLASGASLVQSEFVVNTPPYNGICSTDTLEGN